jgi:glutamate/tyrosine decarboxylase-like PLP-dependent enzyme
MNNAGGRFFGFVNGGSLPAALATDWLVSAWDQNCALTVEAPGAVRLEQTALAWLKDFFQLPADATGAFVTGATMANFSALAAARSAVLRRAGWDLEDRGLWGAPEIRVIVGEAQHASVLKALKLLGFGDSRIERTPVDDQGRIVPGKMPRPDGPAIVCTQVGNVNSGACDPVGEICDRIPGENVWVHVDGAFGLWASASPTYRGLTAGVERADSWAADAHKWLNVPYDCGIAFVRDGLALARAMVMSAAYLQAESTQEPINFVPEGSRRARGVPVWAALRSLGRTGVAELVDRCCAHAQRFAAGLRGAGFEILNDVVLNQVMVSFGTPEQTGEVIRRLQEDGTCWCSGTVWQGRAAMRISVSNWSTTENDVDRSLAEMVRIARAVVAR